MMVFALKLMIGEYMSKDAARSATRRSEASVD
jgi:hypothetical protein